MALQWNVAALDDLAPEVAALYKPDDKHGGYVLDVTEPDAIKKALVVERDARAVAERTVRGVQADAAKITQERDAAVSSAAALRRSVLEMRVREAARTAGLHAAAFPDAVRAAREVFDVGDDGEVKAKDGKATLDGWFAQAKEEAPHWFPATGSGSGAPQSTRSSPARRNSITRRQFEALPAAQRAALVREGTITITD